MMESNFHPPLNGHLRGCRSFGVKIRGSIPDKLGFHLASCNMQLLGNYTIYYRAAIFMLKLLIYMYFLQAWISVTTAKTFPDWYEIFCRAGLSASMTAS